MIPGRKPAALVVMRAGLCVSTMIAVALGPHRRARDLARSVLVGGRVRWQRRPVEVAMNTPRRIAFARIAAAALATPTRSYAGGSRTAGARVRNGSRSTRRAPIIAADHSR